jgi:hypothetical protein
MFLCREPIFGLRIIGFKIIERAEMADLKNKGQQDRSKITMHEEHEVRYWTKQLGVSKEELQTAIDNVGNGAAMVRKQLGK